MKVTREKLYIDAGSYAFDWDRPRSHGCHVMQVIEMMAVKLGMEEPPPTGMPEEALQWYRFGGFVNEYVMAHHLTQIEASRNPLALFIPGEFMWCYECDMVIYPSMGQYGERIGDEHCKTRNHHGICGTPDAMSLRDYSLEEWKCTWKTSNRAGGDNDKDSGREHISTGMWRWPQQTMAYAYAMETEKATLKAMWVNGDYKPPRPSGDKFSFTFTRSELESVWSSLVGYAKRYNLLGV